MGKSRGWGAQARRAQQHPTGPGGPANDTAEQAPGGQPLRENRPRKRKGTQQEKQSLRERLCCQFSAPVPRARLSAAEIEHREHVERMQRARRLPHLFTLGTAAIGSAAWGAAEAVAAAELAPQLATGGVVAGLSAAAALGVAWKSRKVEHALWRRRMWQAGTVSALWVTLATFTGVGWVMLGTLLIAEIVLSAGWQRAHRPGVTTAGTVNALAPAEAPKVSEIPATVQGVAQLWAANVACEGGAVPNSTLSDGQEIDLGTSPSGLPLRGVSFVLQLDAGKQEPVMVRNKIAKIATGLHTAPELVLAEELSRVDGNRDSSKMRLRVLSRSPIDEVHPFTHPIIEGGYISLGPYADGQDEATYRLFDSVGMKSGLVIGGTGSGKSSLVNQLVVAARSTGVINTLYFDPQGGMSSPDLAEAATLVASGMAQAEAVLEAVESLAFWREQYAAYKGGISKFLPTKELPGWLIIIDECDSVFVNKEHAKRWGKLAKKIRKLGMALLGMTQHTGQNMFGGSELLRSSMATNMIALRTDSKGSGGLIPGLPANPATLPDDMPGYGYVKGSSARPVPFRGRFLPSVDDVADPEAQYHAGKAFADHPEPPIADLDRRAIGDILADPEEAAAANQARARANLQRLFSGEITGLPPEITGTRTEGQPRAEQVKPATPSLSVPKVLHLVPDPEPQPAGSDPDLTDIQASVLEAIRKGQSRPADIVATTGWSRAAVMKALKELREAELIHQPYYGRYRDGAGENYDEPELAEATA